MEFIDLIREGVLRKSPPGDMSQDVVSGGSVNVDITELPTCKISASAAVISNQWSNLYITLATALIF